MMDIATQNRLGLATVQRTDLLERLKWESNGTSVLVTYERPVLIALLTTSFQGKGMNLADARAAAENALADMQAQASGE